MEEDRAASLLIAALTIVITVIVAFIATMLIGFEDIVDEDDEDEAILAEEAQPAAAPLPEGKEIRILSPIQGECIPLEQVKDATFSQGILGKGAAVIPEKGEVASPFDGKIDMMFETGHAVGMTSSDGVELLIHVGMDTVNLEGKYFYPKKASGDTVKKGEVILEFDKDEIVKAGYDITTPVIVSNTDAFADVSATASGPVKELDEILVVR
ncbi:MAG: PTS glucose transporter subunit IIA [Lachnospiraceae bacterium]